MYLYVHYNVHGWGWGGEWEGCIMLHYCPRAVKSTPPIVPLLFRWYKPRILLTMLWTERLPMQKLPFQCSPVRYEGSQSDCILLATNGDIQAIYAGSPNVYINLHMVQKVDRGAVRENGWKKACPICKRELKSEKTYCNYNIFFRTPRLRIIW